MSFNLCSQHFTIALITAPEIIAEENNALIKENWLHVPGMPGWLCLGDPDRRSRSPEVSRQGLSYKLFPFFEQVQNGIGHQTRIRGLNYWSRYLKLSRDEICPVV